MASLTAEDVGALPSMGVAADSAKLGGKAPEYYLTPVNLLDNSDFTNPVNQRGVSGGSVSNKQYLIDRWFSAGSGLTYDFTNGVITNNGYLYQMFDKPISGKTYTAAMGFDNEVVVLTGVYEANTSWTNLGKEKGTNGTIQFATDKSGYLYIGIMTHTTSPIKWACLYEGEYTAETLPPYVPKGYAAELAECERYYRRTGAGTGYSIFGFGHASSTVEILMYVPRGKMRIEAPTFSAFVPNGAFQAYNPAGSVDITSLSADQYSGSYWRVKATVSGATSGEFYYLRAKNDLNAYIEENADL